MDLHLHSTASDGVVRPEHVARRAARQRVFTIALTDHDSLDGVQPAAHVGAAEGVRVIAGCEFSVATWWGELHLLGYFLPVADPELGAFLATQRTHRELRAREIVEQLGRLGVEMPMERVLDESDGAPVGRPHIARTLVKLGKVGSVNEAFERYLADGGPAAVAKTLPHLLEVTNLVRRLGGVTSAAHLKHRADRSTVRGLRSAGVDALEVLHPAHGERTVAKLNALASDFGLLKTGGSDWHGGNGDARTQIGGLRVPKDWVEALERLHQERVEESDRDP